MREVPQDQAFVPHRRWMLRDASTKHPWPFPKLQIPSVCRDMMHEHMRAHLSSLVLGGAAHVHPQVTQHQIQVPKPC